MEEERKEKELQELVPFHLNELGYLLEVMLARAKAPQDPQDEKQAFISALRFAYMILTHKDAEEKDKELAKFAVLTIISVLRVIYPLGADKHDWN